jgi:hypothetical protein
MPRRSNQKEREKEKKKEETGMFEGKGTDNERKEIKGGC